MKLFTSIAKAGKGYNPNRGAGGRFTTGAGGAKELPGGRGGTTGTAVHNRIKDMEHSLHVLEQTASRLRDSDPDAADQMNESLKGARKAYRRVVAAWQEGDRFEDDQTEVYNLLGRARNSMPRDKKPRRQRFQDSRGTIMFPESRD